MKLDSNGFYRDFSKQYYLCKDFVKKCGGANMSPVLIEAANKEPKKRGWRKIEISNISPSLMFSRKSIFISGKPSGIDADKYQISWLATMGIPKSFWIKISSYEPPTNS